MNIGWDKAMNGHDGPWFVDFDCEKDGPFRLQIQKVSKITARMIEGKTQYYAGVCPVCKVFCKVEITEPVSEPVGRKPTKRILIDNQEFFIHGRSKMDFPHDLKEVVEEANRLYEERYSNKDAEKPVGDGSENKDE